MASVVVLAYSDREGTDHLAAILREVGIAAAVVPAGDDRSPAGMAWVVRVLEAAAARVRQIMRAVTRS